jgi:hypothetical protein
VGIDIERIRFDLLVAEIASVFFKREDAMLRSLPTDVQHQAFFAVGRARRLSKGGRTFTAVDQLTCRRLPRN